MLSGTFVLGKKKKNILLRQRERVSEGREKAGERGEMERKKRRGEVEGNSGRKKPARVVHVWVPGGPMGGVFSAQGP